MLKVSPASVVQIEIDGVEYKLCRPKTGAVIAFEAALEEAQKGKSAKSTLLFVEHIVSCGLPREVTETLDSDQLLEVFGFLATPKKKDLPISS